jgi:hypothetical protein
VYATFGSRTSATKVRKQLQDNFILLVLVQLLLFFLTITTQIVVELESLFTPTKG